MHDIHNFLAGPMVWISFTFFLLGSFYKLVSMAFLAKKKDPLVYAYFKPKFALRSILHWSIPFGSRNMRMKPLMTVVTYVFHFCLLATPVFLLAHITLVDESWNISWYNISDRTADLMTMAVIACCAYFLFRRVTCPEVRYLTTWSDYAILLIVAAPFISGMWAYHQWAGFQIMGLVHMLSGEIMLMAIPFTRLSHMLYAPFTRGYMGSEFGSVRNARDW